MGIKGLVVTAAAAWILFGPLAAPVSAQESGGSAARAKANLATYVSDHDYPAEAIQKREQGVVGFRLDVDPEGKVTACTVTQSSGSASLDSTSCRIMTERAKFEPARDAQGRPVADTVQSRIRWVLPTDGGDPPAKDVVAYRLWMQCVSGETAKLARTRLSARAVSDKAMAACIDLEIFAGKQFGTELDLIPARNQIRQMTESQLAEARKVLGIVPSR